MGFCSHLQYFPLITFVFLAVPLSNGQVNYTACSRLYSCGKIRNIGYPFWGGDRPKSCGITEFELNCQTRDNQSDTKMNVFQDIYVPFTVLGINTSSQTMKFSRDNLFKQCYLHVTSNVPLLSNLKLNASNNISLFYGCSAGCSRYHSKSFGCSFFDGTNDTAYFFDNPSDVSKISKPTKPCSCQNNVSFPLNKRGLDELGSTNASLWSILTKWPIEAKYKANFTACSKCEGSGGNCGSSSSDQFLCYCQDGTKALMCSEPPSSPRNTSHDKKKEKEMLRYILGTGIGGALLVLVAIIGICQRKKVKFVIRTASLDCSASELEKGSIYFGVPLFSYRELVEATANFDLSKELGNGGFGTVYYGKLKDGRDVAVKRLYEKSYKRLEQFMNEVQILTCLRHQNLVSLYGCTSQHCRELLLVYEYVRNGTVADHLYGKNSESGFLPWPVRLRIALETANALSYLHASDIIHRDVKTHNILLDCNFSVKVADFGISRLFPTDVTHVSTAPQGTPGYLDPEYHQCYHLTDKSDVYSFGVVLIELISSLPAIDMKRPKHEINLFNYAMNRIQRCAFDELVDPQLGFALDFKVRRMTILVAELAFQCLQHDREFRPSMDEVVEALNSIAGADYEALQVEEMAKNVGVEDYEALQADETAELAGVKVVKMQTSNPAPSSAKDDGHSQLLNTHRAYSSFPISVMNIRLLDV